MAKAESGGRPAVFIDRDGTLIEDTGYVGDPNDVRLIPGAAAAVAKLNRAGLPAVLVTNQSGIGRGLFTRADFDATQRRITELLADAGARLDAVYMCPHHPEADGPCDCRKPATGLYRRAAAALSVDPSRSYYVGDRHRDVAAAERLGGTALLVRTGAGGADAPAELPRVADLKAAVDRILSDREEA